MLTIRINNDIYQEKLVTFKQFFFTTLTKYTHIDIIDISLDNLNISESLTVHTDSQTLGGGVLYPLSYTVMDKLHMIGWNIIMKIGQGATSDVFIAYKNEQTGVKVSAIVFLSAYDQDIQNYTMMELTEKINIIRNIPEYNLYFSEIYDIVYIDHPYSDNPKYISENVTPFADRPIQILEYMPYNVTEYTRLNGNWNGHIKTIFTKTLLDFMRGFIILLHKYNMEYYDYNMDNIMVTLKDNVMFFKIIDFESIFLFNNPYNSLTLDTYNDIEQTLENIQDEINYTSRHIN